MQTEHTAFNGEGLTMADTKFVVVIDYPKSEPVLESSYVFPKADCYDNWKLNTASTFTISSDA